MDLLEVIAQSYGGRGVQVLGARFGLNDRQTRAAIDQLAPAVMAGLRRQIQSPEGLQGLVAALATGDHGRYLEQGDARIVDDGNAILGHVFKSKDVSRGVAERASQASGVSPDILRQMLPVVSAMVMGALSKQALGDRTAAGPQPKEGVRGAGPLTRRAGPAAPATAAPSRADETRLARKNRAAAASQPAAPTFPPSPAAASAVRAATQAAQAAPAPSAPAGAGGLGDILGQLFGGGATGGGNQSATGGGLGGGLGAILGQLVGGGSGGAAPAGGGIGDLLGGLFGQNAKPEVRDQATQSIGNLFAGLLGGGTAQGNSADELLDAVTRPRTGR